MPPQKGYVFEELSSWTEESFFSYKMTWLALQWWSLAQTLCCVACWSGHICLSSTIQDTNPEGILSSCGCSLTLTLTTSIGIWHDAGATKSWSSLVSLSCSYRIYLGIRSNYDSGGWATRIIHFSELLFSTLSVTVIRLETISFAIRNHSFRHPIEDRLTLTDISSVAIRAKCVTSLHRLCKNLIHQRNRKHSLFRCDSRDISLTTGNAEGIYRWLWQA